MPELLHSPPALVVWMNGLRVGRWTQGRGGRDVFEYDDTWINTDAGRALSLSLPLIPGNPVHTGAKVSNYFDNLLPDSDAVRRRVQARFSTESTDPFDLLAALGRDCVGAVQLLAPDEAPTRIDRIDAEPMTDTEIERALAASLAPSGGLLGRDADADFRISIAGAQEKIALLQREGRWWRPRGSTPTTHILKLPLGLVGNLQADMTNSVDNEWLCAQLLAAFGEKVAECERARFGAQRVLVVKRFDRAWQEKPRWIARLPQEDFCQVLGLPSVRKYESDGGPGMTDILRVLDGASSALVDKRRFVRAQMLFWLLAATDGHAKNFSIFHDRGGSYRLTPLYDVLSAWPIIGKGAQQLDIHKARLAMAVRSKNVHWKLREIQPRHWDAVARRAGLGDAQELREELCAQAPAAVARVAKNLPRDFPALVAEKIFAGILASAKLLGA